MDKFICNMRIFILIFCLALIGCKQDPPTAESKKPAESNLLEGLDEANNLVKENPNDAHAYFHRANVFYDHDGFQEAEDDVKKAIELDSNKVEYYHLLADLHLDNFKSMNALGTMIKTVKKFPNSTQSKLKLSEFYFILKKYEQSIQTAGSILEEDPQNAEAYFMIGMNFRESGDTSKSINSFQAAIENDPELVDAWLILGSMHESKNDKLALSYYDGALAVQPDNLIALHSKAYFLQNNGEISKALEIYKQIMLKDRNYTDAPLNAGILYLELDSFKMAYDHFNILTNNVPESPFGYFYRGVANEALGNPENAKEDYETALRLKPDYAKAQNALDNIGVEQ